MLRENFGKRAGQVATVLRECADDTSIAFERIAQSPGEIFNPFVSRLALGTGASFDAK